MKSEEKKTVYEKKTAGLPPKNRSTMVTAAEELIDRALGLRRRKGFPAPDSSPSKKPRRRFLFF